MLAKDLVYDMLIMQQNLNDETNGVGWENGYTNKNKMISWKRCIYMECAELIDSFAWKHWKNISAVTDEQNLRVEIVDIWHFMMSLMLEHYHLKSLGGIEKLANDICLADGFFEFCKEPYIVANESMHGIINEVEMLINRCSGYDYDIFEILKIYFGLALKCGVNLDTLYECYIAKNVLNRFRQDNGYKDGKYKKVWNGIEDNRVMSEILAKGIKGADEIYKALEKEYEKVK